MKFSTPKQLCLVLSFFLTLGLLTTQAQQDNWTHFRGSNLNGISNVTKVPVKWSDSTNIMWKIDIEGKGWSSPVVYGNQVWVTTAVDNGKKMFALCLDINTGKQIYNLNLFQPDTVFSKHSLNSYATPTCCIEEGLVWAHFGSYGTACINTTNGSIVWKRTDLRCNHVQGPGSSPIIYKNMLILHFEGQDVQFIVALDKKTGKTIWKTDRPVDVYKAIAPIGKKCYITPIVMNINGEDLLISNGSAACFAYKIETGQEVWRIVKGLDSSVAMPITENGIIYFYTSFLTPNADERYIEFMAVNPKGKGDIAKTSQELYSKTLAHKYNSSPNIACGNVYFTSLKGETLVIKQGNQLQVVAENKLPGNDVYATPAFVKNSILFRNENSLYRIGTK